MRIFVFLEHKKTIMDPEFFFKSIFHIVPAARLEAFMALKLSRLEIFRESRITRFIGHIWQTFEILGPKILQSNPSKYHNFHTKSEGKNLDSQDS